MWALGAAALASLIAFVELHSTKRKPLSLRAVHWIGLRLSADGVAGFLAFGLLRLALGEVSWLTAPWTCLVAGLVGPALLRSQLSLIGSGDEGTYGPATAFRRLQRHADRNIDDISATAQSTWVYATALPVLSSSDGLDQLIRRSHMYIGGLDRMKVSERTESRAFIDAVQKDTASNEDKIASIVQHLIDRGGQRIVRTLVKERRRTRRR